MKAIELLESSDIQISRLMEERPLLLHNILNAMQEYAKLKCAEQREICANDAEYVDFEFIDRESIRNADEPDFS